MRPSPLPRSRPGSAAELAEKYLAVWNEPDADERRRTITELWAEDGRHIRQPPEEMRRWRPDPGSP